MIRIAGPLAAVMLIASTCLAEGPKDAAGFANRGDESFRTGDFDKAIADYSEAIRTDWLAGTATHRPEGPPPLSGPIYESPFRQAFEKRAAMNGTEPLHGSRLAGVYLYRGYAYLRKGEYDRAIADFNVTLHLDPKNAVALRARGHAWKSKGGFDDAIADFDECVRLDPADAAAYGGRANARRAKQEYAAAIADYSESLRLRPDLPYAYNSLAWIWATCPDPRFRNGKKAVEYATKACELTVWKYAPTLISLAAAYAETRNFDEAIKWQEKALELDGHEVKTSATKALERYKQRKPYREKPKVPASDDGVPGDDGVGRDDNEVLVRGGAEVPGAHEPAK